MRETIEYIYNEITELVRDRVSQIISGRTGGPHRKIVLGAGKGSVEKTKDGKAHIRIVDKNEPCPFDVLLDRIKCWEIKVPYDDFVEELHEGIVNLEETKKAYRTHTPNQFKFRSSYKGLLERLIKEKEKFIPTEYELMLINLSKTGDISDILSYHHFSCSICISLYDENTIFIKLIPNLPLRDFFTNVNIHCDETIISDNRILSWACDLTPLEVDDDIEYFSSSFKRELREMRPSLIFGTRNVSVYRNEFDQLVVLYDTIGIPLEDFKTFSKLVKKG